MSLDYKTGGVRWDVDVFDSASFGSSSNDQYFFVGEGIVNEQRMAALDKKNGRVAWLYQYPSQYKLSYPVEYNGSLFLSLMSMFFALTQEMERLFGNILSME